jgi:uncharacterized membrane protein
MTFLSGTAIMKHKRTARQWIVEGYLLPKAVTLLSAPPKCGKSEAAFGMVRAILMEEAFCGLSTRFTHAIVLSEEGEDTLQDKIDGLGKLARHITVVPKHLSGDMDWQEKWQQAIAYARKKRAKLIVIDPMAEWLGLPPGGENTPGLVVEAINVIRQSAREHEVAVLIVHHSRKEGGTFGAGVRGSNGITGAVDIILELLRVEGFDNDRTITALSRFRETTKELVVRYTPTGYLLPGEDETPVEPTGDGLTESERKLLTTIEQEGPLPTPDLISLSGVSKAQVSRITPGLVERGLLVKTGSGVKGDPAIYALPAPEPATRAETILTPS